MGREVDPIPPFPGQLKPKPQRGDFDAGSMKGDLLINILDSTLNY